MSSRTWVISFLGGLPRGLGFEKKFSEGFCDITFREASSIYEETIMQYVGLHIEIDIEIFPVYVDLEAEA